MFEEFTASSRDEWHDKLIADLNGQSESLLKYSDEIEEIDLDCFHTIEDIDTPPPTPGSAPYSRGFQRKDNSWNAMVQIEIMLEREANQKALEALTTGANALCFVQEKADVNWNVALQDIELQFIKTHFELTSIDGLKSLMPYISAHRSKVSVNFDAIEDDTIPFQELVAILCDEQFPVLKVNGFGLQQCGASIYQELAFGLATGHEYLLMLMNQGLSIDEAAASIHFYFGIGSNYLFESVKINAFREMWTRLISAYAPLHSCSRNAQITSISGLTNKSLRDPYTNLLRQTTESLSAVNSGTNNLLILPYDFGSQKGTSELAARMALNIQLILQHESYADAVITPLAGSYSCEKIQQSLAKNAWEFFREIEQLGGLTSASGKALLHSKINQTKELRIQRIQEKKDTLIGINAFRESKESDDEWKAQKDYLGLAPLILETELKAV